MTITIIMITIIVILFILNITLYIKTKETINENEQIKNIYKKQLEYDKNIIIKLKIQNTKMQEKYKKYRMYKKYYEHKHKK